MAPTTSTIFLLGDGARSDESSMLFNSPSTPDLPSSDMSANTIAPSHGLLVARQSGSSPNDYDAEDTDNGHNMSVYYFVFFALLVCIAVLCIYFVWRRRRNALMVRPNPRGEGYHRDVREWDTMRYRRRYWNTGLRNEEPSREEGLNENGEAPPPYMPKEDDDTGSNGPHLNGQRAHVEGTPVPGEPSIPMQTLSRDQAGLKPPGYEQSVQPASNGASVPLPSQASHTLPLATVRSPLSETTTRGNQDDINPIDLTSSPTQQPQQENASPPARAGTKRKSTSNDNGDENDVNLSDIDVEGMPLTENPDQIRRKIHRLIDNGGMRVGEFCNAIQVSDNAYRRFVSQSGRTKGLQSDVYMAAAAYFKKREIAGLKLPTANSKKAKTNSGASAGASNGGGSGGSPSGAGDFRQIELPGEATDSVPVYDTCADVRRKISAYLRELGITQAQFCRDLYGQLHGPDKGASVGTSQLQRFRGKSGANEGGDSKVFYAGYVFFEKKRIAEKKPKSKKRLEMEKVWPNGVDRETFGRLRVICHSSQRPHFDDYGKLQMVKI